MFLRRFYVRMKLFVLPKRRSDYCSRGRGCLLASWTQRRPVLPQPRPAPPCRPAVRRPDLTCPWCVRVLGSTSLRTTTLHYAILWHTRARYGTLCCSKLRYAILSCAMLRYSTKCCAMRHFPTLDYAMLHYAWVCLSPVESKTRIHHGPVGSGRRTAGQRGGAGQGRTGRRWVDPARR